MVVLRAFVNEQFLISFNIIVMENIKKTVKIFCRFFLFSAKKISKKNIPIFIFK